VLHSGDLLHPPDDHEDAAARWELLPRVALLDCMASGLACCDVEIVTGCDARSSWMVGTAHGLRAGTTGRFR
jgi:hypothetical protein